VYLRTPNIAGGVP